MSSFTGWGRSTWGNGAWGSRGTLSVTGVEASATTSKGWGRNTWSSGTWGSPYLDFKITAALSPVGVGANGSTGIIVFQDELITGWGRSTWGSGLWGDPAIIVETGLQAASTIGTPTFIHGDGVEPVGIEVAGAVGTVGFGTEFDVTGVEATGSVNRPNVWSVIDTSSGTIWTEIAA
tara:strand:- start:1519 stop:2049 length:531 start_codon:yes stop_codon:yes gene_type:complete